MFHGEPMTNLDEMLGGLKAAAEETRLRLLALFTKAELTVTEGGKAIGRIRATDVLGKLLNPRGQA